ncbi:hypothetical protein VTO73DRAFT_2349 [Trametes versicolor]
MNIPAENGVPLLKTALAPIIPLEIGTKVFMRMLGPPVGNNPWNRRRAFRDIGVEGRIVAARLVNGTHVEFMVKNESWSLANYVAILTLAVAGATVSRTMLDTLRASPPSPISHADHAMHPCADSPVIGIPGVGRYDSGLLYLLCRPTATILSRFKQPHQQIQSRSAAEVSSDIKKLRGHGWVNGTAHT